MNVTLKDSLFVFAVFILFTYSYKRAGGSLSLTKLNAISFSYYLLLITVFFGGAIIFQGFRDHYVAIKIQDETARIGFYFICYSVIALPLFISLFNRLMGIKNYGAFFDDYVKREVEDVWRNENSVFTFVFIASLICGFSVLYTLYHIGHVALLDLLRGRFYMMSYSALINREFSGNIYIKNIFAIGMTPILSYVCYIYSYYTKKLNWRILFWIMLFLTILIKTYDFSKAPVVIYLFYFYIIRVLFGSASNMKSFIRYGAIGATIIILAYYVFLGYRGELFSFTHGPLSRLMVSQIAGLFMHVQLFPKQIPFLHGTSFPKTIALLLGKEKYGVRSARLVMTTLWPNAVDDGTSGVMNTFFTAEAYANYGVAGVLVAPIIVAFCFSFVLNFILRQKKTPITISIYILYTYSYVQALVGGFVDYIYSGSLFIITVFLILINVLANGGRITIRL